MKFTLYFLGGKLHCATFTVNGVEHSTHDCRLTVGNPNEVCLVTSKKTVKNNDGLDMDSYMDEHIERGYAIKREFEAEPVFKDWNNDGYSYTTINHAFVKPPCGKCSQCKCALDM